MEQNSLLLIKRRICYISIYMQESPRMMTLVIEVGAGVFWTFDLVPALDGEVVYFVKEDYADVTNPENWDHVTIHNERSNQGLQTYVKLYNGGPSGTLWYLVTLVMRIQ